jgi:N-acetylornithine carbamoyltransferase
LQLAARVKRGEVTGGLEKKVLAMVFMDPSLRTRTSFETAMFLHGGHGVVLEPGKGSWSLETEPGAVMDKDTVEHIIDAARVLGRYADAVGVRSFPRGSDWAVAREDAIVRNFAKYCEKSVINFESARRHPCQALADAMTLREKLRETEGKRFVLTWAWHPKALPTAVPASAALAAAALGMEIVIARPPGYELDPEDTALIRKTAQQAGGDARADLMSDRIGTPARVIEASGKVGGGALPLLELTGPVCAVDPGPVGLDELARRLRAGEPPLVARAREGWLLLDPRTLTDDEARLAAEAVAGVLSA